MVRWQREGYEPKVERWDIQSWDSCFARARAMSLNARMVGHLARAMIPFDREALLLSKTGTDETIGLIDRYGCGTVENDLHKWKVSVLAQNGLTFDLSTSSGKLMRTIMAGLADAVMEIVRRSA